jgi:hypothetical protein
MTKREREQVEKILEKAKLVHQRTYYSAVAEIVADLKMLLGK